MIQLIVIQVLALVFTLGFVRQQRASVRMMIDYVPQGTMDGKIFHQGNWLVALVFSLACLLGGGLFGFTLAALWYISLFDPLTIRANWANRNWWELGSEAWWDRLFTKVFGSKAGYYKLLAALILIITLNILALQLCGKIKTTSSYWLFGAQWWRL